MYETLEHWKQYKQEKDLQNKIAQEFELFNECGFQYKEKAKQEVKKWKEMDKAIKRAKWEIEFDKWMDKLIAKNGTTNY